MAAQFMKAPYQTFKTLPSKQKGAVLLVSVVTLSLLALAGLSTVEQTVVQERTSVNSKAADDATRNAEKGLKQAVADLTNGDVFTNGFCTENLSTEDPANWECEKVSEDGYTYVVSYIMNGDQPATDDNGDTIYKVSVVGVRSGSSGGSLATQSLTAGVVVRDASAVGVWDAAVIGCRQVLFEDSVSVEGDVLNTNAIASMMLTDDGGIDGNVFYTDNYTKSEFFTIDGETALSDEAECDPLVVSNVFATHLNVFADNNQSQSDYEQPTSGSNRRDDTISTDQYYDDFVFRDKKLTFEGTTNIYVQNKLELKEANIDVKNDSDVINIYVGSPDGSDYDGDVLIHDVKFGVKGTLNIYVADEFLLKGTEINFQGTSPQFNVFVGSPDGAAFDGNVEIEESFFTGGGSGRASEEFIMIFGLFGDSEVEEPSNVCNGERNGSMTVVDTPNGKTFGGRLYAPRAHICVDDAQFRGSIRGYDVILRDDDTRFVYSVAEELQGSDSDSEVSAYSLLFYTRGDVDFVAGGETACEQTGVAGSSSSSTSGGSGEASVNCDAVAERENDTSHNNDDDSGNEGSGNDSSGRDSSGYDSSGYDSSGYDRSGRDSSGYDRDGYDSSGYDRDGYDSSGYDRNGRDSSGYDGSGYDGSGYDRSGYDRDGYDSSGYDRSGYDSEGYNSSGYNRSGYDRDGYNASGYDSDGYDRSGYDSDGYNSAGFNSEGYDQDGYDSDGYNEQGYDRDGNRASGDISIEVDRVNTDREYVDFDFGDSDLDGLTVSSIQFDAFPGDVLDKIYFGDNSNNVNIRDNDLPYTINFSSRDGAFRDSTTLRLEFDNNDNVEGTYTFTITFSDGSTVTFNARVRD